MDRTALARATEGSDAPTPGYLYLDIAKSVASNPSACRDAVQYLTRRLQKNNHNIKYKCLKVMAKTAESPITRGQFKREICQDPQAVRMIKEALQYRGPPDPVRGDQIYSRVREMAKECLDAIYSDNPTSESMGASSGNAALGYSGGGGGGGGGYSSGYGARKMEGFGNPQFSDPRMEPQSQQKGIGNMTIGEVASVVGETFVGMIKDPLAKNVNVRTEPASRIGNMPGYGGGGGGGGGGGYGGGGYGNPSASVSSSASYGYPPGRDDLANRTGGQWTMASNRGPNAVVPPSNYNSEKDEAYFKARDAGSSAFQWAQQQTPKPPSGVGGSWGSTPTAPAPSVAQQARVAPHQNYSQPAQGHPSHHPSTSTPDGQYERNLIMELCPPGGLRPEPPQDKLRSFAESISSLDPDLVCPPLLDALEDGQPWIIKAKALCVIETTLQTAAKTSANNAYNDFFYENVQEIEPLASHNRAAIRDPAQRVLRLLGLARTVPPEAPPEAPSKPVVQEEPANLLDFDDETPSGGAVQGSMFGGLTVAGVSAVSPPPVAAPPPPEPEVNLLGGEEASEGGGGSSGGGGLFGGMQVKANGTHGGGSAVPTESPKTTESSATPAVTTSGFGFLTEPQPTTSTTPVTPVTPTNPTSSTTNELLELGQKPTQPPSPQKQSFDPLLNGTTTQNPLSQPMMNANMSNNVYQQNMMMMQQQMQQMQLALAMQQQQQQQRSYPQQRPIQQGQVINPNVMGSNTMRQIPIVGAPPGNAKNSFSFLDNPTMAKKQAQQKSFDFIKDAMKSAK